MMRKPQGKQAKRQAVEKQRLRDEADAKRQRSEEPGVCPLLVRCVPIPSCTYNLFLYWLNSSLACDRER